MSCKIGDQLKDRFIEAVIAEDNYANPEKGLAGGYAFEIEKATLRAKRQPRVPCSEITMNSAKSVKVGMRLAHKHTARR